jgi:N6-adenosine-specific RNA methylase IME4
MELIINEELKKLLPPLTSDEFKILEENIVCDGCREPLITWNNILIDGHNRYEICKTHNLLFDTKEIESDNIEDVKLWIIDNQKGRRNLTDGWKYELAQVRKEILLKQGNEKQKEAGKEGRNIQLGGLSTIDRSPAHNTRNEIADELGWSTGKVAMADKVWKDAKPEMKEAIKAGETTFNQAYQEIKKEEKIEQIKDEQKKRFETLKLKELDPISKLYDVIVIDPPWKMEKIKREVAPLQVGFDYPTMEIEEIKNIILPAENNCHVFLWITHKHLPDGFEILKSWGVKYICCFVWHKNGGFQPWNLPQYNCEFSLYGRIGTPEFFDTKDFNVCFNADRTGHSEKPELFYSVLRRVTAGNRIDMFNRRDIDGFDKWGNEV